MKPDQPADAQIQLDFINKRLGHNVPLKLPFTTVLLKNLIMFAVASLAVILVAQWRTHLLTPMVWFSISIGGYIICTSGFIYSELHNMPMFRFDRDQYGSVGVSEYFMRQQRGQYAGEGYIASFIATLASLTLLFVTRVEKFELSPTQRRIILAGAILFSYLCV